MTEVAYEDLVAEAFIDPIRSVLIVDDDYPTLSEVLADDEEKQRHAQNRKKWRDDRESVRNVLRQFRDPRAPLLLDIHDGTVPAEEKDEEQVGELQQTDLLILDYELERGGENGGLALRIARKALSNEHFNLILVHTEKDLDSVFFEFVTGLYEPMFKADGGNDPSAILESFEADFGDALRASLSRRHLAYAYRDPKNWASKLCGDDPEWNEPRVCLERAVGDIAGFTKSEWRAAVIRAFAYMEAERPPHDRSRPVKVLEWRNDGIRFVRTDRGFMAFRSKTENPSVPLLDTVKAALNAWGPDPSRLLLSKLRAEMDRRGIEVQDDALGKPHTGAIWYRDLLGTDERQISAAVDRTVRNHAEQLLDQILPGVSKFVNKMIELESPNATAETVKARFRIDLMQPDEEGQAVMAHNAFVGSKPVSGAHLELGHILAVGQEKWLCVTPACDLVPGRGGAKRPDKGGGLKRFTALRLYAENEGGLLETATRGGRIFANLLENDGTTGAHAFKMASCDNASPAWIIMYAEDDGILKIENEKRSIGVRLVKIINGDPEISRIEASVIGHLRPEYALDIQARLTGTQSRIGLDLKNLSSGNPDAE